MKKYPVVAVLWNDPHIVLRDELPNVKEDFVFGPTLTVGLLFKQTDEFIILIHTVERQDALDEADYTVIFRGCVISIKEYGQIELEKLRPKGAN